MGMEEKKESTHKEDNKAQDINIDVQDLLKRAFLWTKQNYVILLVLIPIILSILIRIQPAYLPIMDDSAENNVYSSVYASVEATINAQYPNLPDANRQAMIQEQVDAIYAAGEVTTNGQTIIIDDLIAENAQALKDNFQDEYGLTYLGEIDPWYFYRLSENYLEHGYEGDIEINGRYFDTHQLGGTPRESLGGETQKLPHFHVAVEVFLYKFLSFFMPNIRLMTVVYFLPVLLAALSVIPAFFMVRKVAGSVGALVASILVAVHPAFVGRTVAGFSDTDGYNVLFPLFIMWAFIEAVEAKRKRYALLFATFAALLVGMFSKAWGGWWYIYDFLLGICFISLWYLYVKEWTKEMDRKKTMKYIALAIPLAPFVVIGGIINTLYKACRDRAWRKHIAEYHVTTLTITSFVILCAVFVSLFSTPVAFINAVKEPFTFTTIKDVAIAKIWPNVLTTVAEFNPASLNDILTTASFGMTILLFCGLLGNGYALFERKHLSLTEEKTLAITLVWVLGMTFVQNRIGSSVMYVLLLLLPLAWVAYKKMPLQTGYFVGVGIWYAILLRFTGWFASNVFVFFFLIALPVLLGILYALLDKKEIDLKYGVLLLIWFVGTIYASTKGVRFIMILVPAFSVAVGLGVAFLYKLFADVTASYLKLKKHYVQAALLIGVVVLLVIPISVGHSTGKNQLPLINDQWYDALKKIDNEAAPDAIISSWWDFGHWFKAIADRAVTFDGGTQDTPQAHWIGRAMLTNDEQEAVAILRMLDCGGNTAYERIVEIVEEPYDAVNLIKTIILQSDEQATQTLLDAGISSEQVEEIMQYTHCEPPEAYFITSQDMVGKAPVWAHFGAWDFDRAHIVNLVNNYPKEEALQRMQDDIGLSADEAENLYQEALISDPNNWIAPWPSYVSMPTECWQEDTLLYCSAGLIVNLTNGDALVQTGTGEYGHPKELFFINPDGDYDYESFADSTNLLINGDRTYSAALVPFGNNFKGFFMDEDLMDSMFTKLFFYQGHNLECFDLFDYQSTVTQEDIYVWKVDWTCADANLVYESVLTN